MCIHAYVHMHTCAQLILSIIEHRMTSFGLENLQCLHNCKNVLNLLLGPILVKCQTVHGPRISTHVLYK